MIVLITIIFALLLEESRPHAMRTGAFIAWCSLASVIGVAVLALYAAQEGLIP